MRKIIALFILVAIFFPLAFASLALISVRPWMLDRGFYENLVNDERLYEPVLKEDLPDWVSRDVSIAGEQLPISALSAGLREIVTPAYLRDQSLSIVDQAFHYLDNGGTDFTLTFDIAPIKTALSGERDANRFATAMASALPPCAANQAPMADGGRLTRCIADDGSIDAAARQISTALPAVLEDLPDRLILNDRWYVRMNWYDVGWLRGFSVMAAVDLAILTMTFMASGAVLAASMLGGDDPRGRIKWLSSSLFVPGSIFVFMGLVIGSPLISGPVSRELTTARWSTQYSEAFGEAVADVIVPAIQQVGSGVLVAGAIVCLIAAILLILSLAMPVRSEQFPRFVDVPARVP